jgi:HD-like signal output (HDOD) protein
LVAGLLHDIGQLWLDCFATAQHSGADHTIIGAWLVHHWALPVDVIAAVAGHHQPDAALNIPLVPLVHVSVALSHAMGLAGRQRLCNGASLSGKACRQVGIVWEQDNRHLLGRIKARSRYIDTFLSCPQVA